MLSATFVTMSRLSTACYRDMSLYCMLSLCAIGNISCHSFIILNFAGLLSIVVGISTQLSMMSRNENEAFNAITFNMITEHFVEFIQCFCSKTGHFMANLGANMVKHVSEIGLYIILSTLERFEHWNRTVLIKKYQRVKQCQVQDHAQ